MKQQVTRLVVVERRALQGLGSVESHLLDLGLPRLSRAADHGVLWIGVAGGLTVSGRSGRRAAAHGLIALSVASVVTNILLKRALGRPRPPTGLVPTVREPRRMPLTTSFPSGHAASAAAFTTAVVLEIPWTWVPLVPLSAAVAASRVVIGVHYPSDVVAGLALGAVVAGAVRPFIGPAGP
jgi:membrane-associated phospholipid phosphatase